MLGCHVGDTENESFRTAFLRTLKARGCTGCSWFISDAQEGLKNAVGAVLVGSSWQRCWLHFTRDARARIAKGHGEMATAAIRTVFAQPYAADMIELLDVIAATIGPH